MFKNDKIFILGFARSGYEAAKLLAKRGNKVVLNDMREEQDKERVKELQELGVEIILGSHPDDAFDNTFNYLIKNPGVPIDHKYVLKARELGIEVINEVEMAYRLMPKDVTLIGITGTNGKTTTTTLIYEMINKSNRRVHLTGNIGYPLCGFLEKLESNDIIVMETSCQQLENLNEFKPNIAVMTNLSEAHIDFLKSYDNYKRVKKKIFKNHTKENIAILNIEDEDVIESTKDIKSTVKYFSSKNQINGSYIKGDAIYYYDEKIVDLQDIRLVGMHNYENIMAAIMVVKELGIKNSCILEVLKTFAGVEHRLEFVKEINNRLFYNDSKATNVKSTQIALSSFNKPTILLLGGMERGQDFYGLKEYLSCVKMIVCYGENKNRIKEFGDNLMIETKVVDDIKMAVIEAYQSSSEGDVILLSPASASWDQYKCFEDRGTEYKEQVFKLGENNEYS
ncbi:MAG: UDP-N-acetylmuramoyl-L-alanine--D-glutamate ligase [Bacilli bacterium]|nr:UDP-N-acetylmuramoyl-L-alanine--D-glutamate ligase [Bacilli bacterium]